jgi:molybdopterin-guanine dinucleotide biosynthesis protein A
MGPEIEAAILAGGKSRRMGRDKALLPFGGCGTLTEYQYRRLLPLFDRVRISAKEEKFPFDAPLIPDCSETYSPMVALASILEAIESDGVFLLGVDMPFVPRELITAMRERFDPARGTILAAKGPQGVEPLCALYPRSLLPEVRNNLKHGHHRLRELLKATDAELFPWEDPRAFRNLNRPEEYLRATEQAESEESDRSGVPGFWPEEGKK